MEENEREKKENENLIQELKEKNEKDKIENEREKKKYENLLHELREKNEKDKIEYENRIKELIKNNEKEKEDLENLIKELTENNEKEGNEKIKKEKIIEEEEAIPLDLDTALENSSYKNYNKKFIHDFLLYNYINNKDAKIYFLSKEEEKIFVIEYKLTLTIVEKTYNLNLYIHIPILYPDLPPHFYLEKKKKIGLAPHYLNGKIDPQTFEINIKEFCPYLPSKNNVEEIIKKITNEFEEDFPVFRDKSNKIAGIPGKNTFNKKELNIIV